MIDDNDTAAPNGRDAQPGAQIDWVLQANTDYHRYEDNTVVGTTDGQAIFTFPLSASFGTGTSPQFYWTGLSPAWASAAQRCTLQWDDGTGGNNGRVGDYTDTTTDAIDDGIGNIQACNTSQPVLCVQQP